MMLQLFVMVIMLTLAAFEAVFLFEGHFVTRSVSQAEAYFCEQGVLDFLVNHGVARLISDQSFRQKIVDHGSQSYSVSVERFVCLVGKKSSGLVTCSSVTASSFQVVASLEVHRGSSTVETIVSDISLVEWDENRSLYTIRHKSSPS